ncbi:MAG: hypothetical protein A2534_03070 [Candidatus Magasanikbacteria bacterium RIFOXYD2_FULL_39_9]|uniref:Uncharacterized protein n=1 Tax=Candidatus Magasanikbacteria bacterium RIFOXYD1_FULL_40_23 TaxID=1798705 RepID=A0A1F6PAP2_9BACT|nr:MAG: hypothetical protein A2534_03070 [Candidatus Magasanikbacteria bacterium RIFOXYD2_FULL_39_9]OGH93255.1 MAG: hypothetical protein A2563_01460 [Candidatus Magasanikbacteria bacterium RIFOXYD1_FULL_40_23]
MSKIKLAFIILISILFGAGIILAGFWFLSGKLFSAWTDKIVAVNQQSVVQSTPVQPGDCSLPVSKDMALLDKHETVRQASLKCTAFEEEKLQYDFDPKNALTWDNAFPSRENWANRLKIFKKATKGITSAYYVEKYDFTFSFPYDWDVLVTPPGYDRKYRIVLSNPGNQLVRPMVITVQDYNSSSDVASEWVQNESGHTVLTKLGLLQKKKQIENSVKSADGYGKFVVFGNDYSTSEYHNFYRHAEFFIGNNLITIIQPLSVIVPDTTGYGKEQEELLSKINNGSVDGLVSVEVKLIDFIAAFFRQDSLYPGD